MQHTFYILTRDDSVREVDSVSGVMYPDADTHANVAAHAQAEADAHGGPVYAFHVSDASGRDRTYVHGVATCGHAGATYARNGVNGHSLHESRIGEAMRRFDDASRLYFDWLSLCVSYALRNGETREYADAFAAWTNGPYVPAGTGMHVDALHDAWRALTYS